MRPQAVVMTLHGFCGLRRRPPPEWFDALFAASGPRLAYFRGSELAMALAALASLRALPPRPWLVSALAKLGARLPALGPRELAAAAWAAAHMRRLRRTRPPQQQQRRRQPPGHERGGGSDDEAPPRLKLAVPSQRWMDALAAAAGALLPGAGGGGGASGARLRPEQVSVIAWAFWRCRYRPSPRRGGRRGGRDTRWEAVRAAQRAGRVCEWRRAVGVPLRRLRSPRQFARVAYFRTRLRPAAAPELRRRPPGQRVRRRPEAPLTAP
ncbi:MAG: hypothetical protein J3K34DRAFT_216664 [Monoraphidium minutum]|nr:MAG: hypothetical protein J3K34DRAFT_216664 [Monoraphidium minutum]